MRPFERNSASDVKGRHGILLNMVADLRRRVAHISRRELSAKRGASGFPSEILEAWKLRLATITPDKYKSASRTFSPT
jgi:hypothetical protein